MKPVLKTLPAIVCAIALVGCANPFGKEGYLRDKSGDYTKQETTVPIKVPDGFNARLLGSTLQIPSVPEKEVIESENLSADFAVPRPAQRLKRQGSGEVYRIRHGNDTLWIEANKSPAALIPLVENFFSDNAGNKVALSRKAAKDGVLETDWYLFGEDNKHGIIFRTVGKLVGAEDLDPMEDRFQITVSSGKKANTSIINIKHQGRPPVKAGETPPADPVSWNNLGERSLRMDQALASDLLIFLAQYQDNRTVSYQAQKQHATLNTELTQDGNGSPLLRLTGLSYAQSWSTIEEALAKAKIAVVDKNRSAGIYYLSTNPETIAKKPPEKPGFFSRLFGSDKRPEQTNTETLRLMVSELPEAIQVSVEKDSSTFADRDESLRLLEMLKKYLIP